MTTVFDANPMSTLNSIGFNQNGNLVALVTKTKAQIYMIDDRDSSVELHWEISNLGNIIRAMYLMYETSLVVMVGGRAHCKEVKDHQSNEPEEAIEEDGILAFQRAPDTTTHGTTVVRNQRSLNLSWNDSDCHTLKLMDIENRTILGIVKTPDEIVNVVCRIDFIVVQTLNNIMLMDVKNFDILRTLTIQPPFPKSMGFNAIATDPVNYKGHLNSSLFAVSQKLMMPYEEYIGLVASGQTPTKLSSITVAFQSIGEGDRRCIGILSNADNDEFKIVNITKKVHSHHIQVTALSFDGEYFASASENGTVINVRKIKQDNDGIKLRRGSTVATIYAIAFSFDNSFVAATSSSGTVHIWNLKELTKNTTGITYYLMNSYYKAFAWHYKGPTFPSVIQWVPNVRNGRYRLRIVDQTGHLISLSFDSSKGGDCLLEDDYQFNTNMVL